MQAEDAADSAVTDALDALKNDDVQDWIDDCERDFQLLSAPSPRVLPREVATMQELSQYLFRLRGTALRGFRIDLDTLCMGRVPYPVFVTACRELGIAGKRAWMSFKRDMRLKKYQALRFQDVAPEEAHDIDKFVKLLLRHFGLDMGAVWEAIDWRRVKFVNLFMFAEFAKRLGFEGNVVRLFRGLDVDGNDRLGYEEFEYLMKASGAAGWLRDRSGPVADLVRWICLDFEGSAAQFRQALVAAMGRAAERELIPVGHFAAGVHRLGFAGDALAAARALARSRAGTHVDIEALGGLVAASAGEEEEAPLGSAAAGSAPRSGGATPRAASARGRRPRAEARPKHGGALPAWDARLEDLSLRNSDRCAVHRDYFGSTGPPIFHRRDASPRLAARRERRPPPGPPTVAQMRRASSASAIQPGRLLSERESLASLGKWSVLSCSTSDAASSEAQEEPGAEAQAAEEEPLGRRRRSDGADAAEESAMRRAPYVFLRFMRGQSGAGADEHLMLFMDAEGKLHWIHHEEWPMSDLPPEIQDCTDASGRYGVFYLTFSEGESGRKALSSIAFHEFLDEFSWEYVLSKLGPTACRNVRQLLSASKTFKERRSLSSHPSRAPSASQSSLHPDRDRQPSQDLGRWAQLQPRASQATMRSSPSHQQHWIAPEHPGSRPVSRPSQASRGHPAGTPRQPWPQEGPLASQRSPPHAGRPSRPGRSSQASVRRPHEATAPPTSHKLLAPAPPLAAQRVPPRFDNRSLALPPGTARARSQPAVEAKRR